MRYIKFMPDYGCFPLWEAAPGGATNIDPKNLPISSPLQHELDDWAATYDATLNSDDPMSSGFKSESEEDEFRRRGTELASRLRSELGTDFTVVVSL